MPPLSQPFTGKYEEERLAYPAGNTAAKGKKTRTSDRDLVALIREGRSTEDVSAATGITAAHINTRLHRLGLGNDGQPMTAPVVKREPVVTWHAEDDQEWLYSAACATEVHNPEVWFPANILDERVRMAKEICGRCDVRAKCLDVALKAEAGLSRQYRAGIVGGLTVDERMLLGAEAVA